MSVSLSAEHTARRGAFTFLRHVAAAVREGLEFASRYRTLSVKSDRELAALGLSREDLPRVTVQGWKR